MISGSQYVWMPGQRRPLTSKNISSYGISFTAYDATLTDRECLLTLPDRPSSWAAFDTTAAEGTLLVFPDGIGGDTWMYPSAATVRYVRPARDRERFIEVLLDTVGEPRVPTPTG